MYPTFKIYFCIKTYPNIQNILTFKIYLTIKYTPRFKIYPYIKIYAIIKLGFKMRHKVYDRKVEKFPSTLGTSLGDALGNKPSSPP